MAASLEIIVFGRFWIGRGRRELTSAVAPSVRRLLAHLLFADGPLNRRMLAAALWPDEAERTAGANLRRHVHELTRALGELGVRTPLVRTATTLELHPAVRDAVDLGAYRRAVASGRHADAVLLYAEPVFPGPDDEWLATVRARFREQQVDMLYTVLDAALAGQDAPAVYDAARRLMDLDPLCEARMRRARVALRNLGDADRARRLFARYATLPRDGAGFAATSYGGAAVLDLPVETTPFLGREREVTAVREALVRARLVTVAGPPGVGKSRVALRAARLAASDLGASARYVDLAAPGAAASLQPAAAQAARGSVVVLDNADALGDALRATLRALLSRVRDAWLIVSARTPLHLEAEHVVALGPLEVPREGLMPAAEIERYPGVAFFVDRANRSGVHIGHTHARLALVAEICREYDGLPLALELAAERSRGAGLGGVRTLARERFRAFEPLRLAFEASHGRLSDADRAVFRRLGVFRSPWTLAEAEAVTGLARAELADCAARLADASLLEPDHENETFAALRSTSEFMRLKLAECGELAELELRHAHAVASPIVARDAQLRGAGAARAFDNLEQRFDDVRACLETAVVQGRAVELGVRTLAALSRFLYERSHALEGCRWYDAALARLTEPSPLRAEALFLRAILGRGSGSGAVDLAAFEAAIVELRTHGGAATLAKALLYAANAARALGRAEHGRRLAREANTIVSARDDASLLGFSHAALGAAEFALGDLTAAQREFSTARDIYGRMEAARDEALMIVNVARCVLGRGDAASALPLVRDALALALGVGNRYVEAHARLTCALAALDHGDSAGARPQLVRAAEIALGGADVELSLVALEAAAELWVAEGDFERAASALAAADGVRAASSLRRAPAERARCDRARDAAGAWAAASTVSLRAPESALRALLTAVTGRSDETPSSMFR